LTFVRSVKENDMVKASSREEKAAVASDSDRVVLLDRDGVINADRPGYILNWKQFTFLPGSKEALTILKEHGYRVHIVSNQSAVGRGLMTGEELDAITARMLRAIRRGGGEIEGVHYCPHRPDENCNCRKPKTGLLKEVARKFRIPLRKAWLIGDKLTDMEAGNAVGCRTILVKTAVEPEAENVRPGQPDTPEVVAENLLDAVRYIVGEGTNRGPAARRRMDRRTSRERGECPR
jgi:D-glycero-D-manno-heptose 1,7-bisphosphate phosphatase